MDVYKQCLSEENGSGIRVKVICAGRYLKCKYHEFGLDDGQSDEMFDQKDQVSIKLGQHVDILVAHGNPSLPFVFN